MTSGVLVVVVASIAAQLPTGTAYAATGINQEIDFQGKLTNINGTNVADGTYNMEFKIYTGGNGCVSSGSSPCGGTLAWTEDYLGYNSQGVSVTDGIFHVNLGSITSLPTSVFNNDTDWLSINLGTTSATCTSFSTCGGDGEMTPFIRFTSSPYAMNSMELGGLTASSFAQLSPASAQSGYLNVTGDVSSGATIAATTSLQAPLVDTASAVQLAIGTGTASSILMGRTTTPFTIQGNTSSIITATSGSYTSTLGFQAPTTASDTLTLPNAGGTICTSVASTCSGTYATGSTTGSYLTKNGVDTSTVTGTAVTAGNYLYGFINNSTATTGGVLDLSNAANTGDALYVTASANPATATNALIVANNTAGTSGNLIDLQNNGANEFSVDYNGNVTQNGGSSTTDTINGQTISSAANFTGTVTAATSVLTPLLDTPSGTTTLNIGTNNATAGIDLNQNTTVASNKSLTADGSATFEDATNSPTALVVENNTTNPILTVNTSSGEVGVDGSSASATLQVKNTSNNSTVFDVQDNGGTDIIQGLNNDNINLGKAPTTPFGNTNPGTAGGSDDGNLIAVGFTTSSSGGGAISSLSAYIGSTIASSPHNLGQVGIYSNSSGAPGTLLASSSQLALTANSWNTFPVSYTLAASTTYWFTYWENSASGLNRVGLETPTTGTTLDLATTAFAGSLPSTWPGTALSFGNYDMSIYATYSASSAPALALNNSTNQADFGYNTGVYLQGSGAYFSNNQGNTDAEAFGLDASAAGSDATALGEDSFANYEGTAVGQQSYAGSGSSALGLLADGNAADSVALGAGATPGNYGIALGNGATGTAAYQLVIGSAYNGGTGAYIQNAYIGSGVTDTSPQSITLNATGGHGTDIGGANFTLAGGIGTGKGNGGNVAIEVAKPSGTSGTTANSLQTVATFSGINGAATLENSVNSSNGFQVQNASGYSMFNVNTSTGAATFGDSAHSVAGSIALADGTTDGFVGTIDLSGTLTAGATYQLPNLSGTQTICTSNTSSCSTAGSGYILNQSLTPGTAQTGNFDISGTGIAATSLQAPLIDAAATGALNIGATSGGHATSINLNQNTTIANNSTLTVSGGLTTLQAGLTVTGAATNINAGSNYATNINTGTSTGAVSIGNLTNAGAVSINSDAASNFTTAAGNLTLQAGGGTVSLGSSQILSSTGALTVTGGTTLTLNSTGTNAITLDSGTTGGVNIGTGANSKTIQIGTSGGSGTWTQALDLGTTTDTTGTVNVSVGSTTNSADTVTLQGGATTEALANAGDTIQTSTNSGTAYQVQNSIGVTELGVGTTTSVNYIADPEFAVQSGGTPTDWSSVNSPTTFTQNTTAADSYEGQTSLKLVTSGTTQGTSTTHFTSAPPTAASGAGEYYAVSFYAMLGSGSALANTLSVAATGGGSPTCTMSEPNGALSVTSTSFRWVSCDLTFTSASTISALTITDGTSGQTIYIDGVQLQQVASATALPTPLQLGTTAIRGIDTAPLTVEAAANSTNALQVATATGSNVLTVDTTDSSVGIDQAPGSGSALTVLGLTQSSSFATSTSTTGNGYNKNYGVGTGGVHANDVVVLVNDSGTNDVIDSTTSHDPRVMGVALSTQSSGGVTSVTILGNAQVTATSAAVAIGDQLVVSSTSGEVMTDNSATTGILGYATSAKSSGSSGLVGVYVRPVGGVNNEDVPSSLTIGGTTTSTSGTLALQDGTADGYTATIALQSALSGSSSYYLPNNSTLGQTICTTVASSCSSVYEAAGAYLLQNPTSNDASSSSFAGYQYSFTQTSTGAAGNLSLANSGTGDALSVSGSGNPSGTNALEVINNTAGSPSGNSLDVQSGGVNELSVAYNGNISQINGSSTTDTINGQTISAAANFTGTVTAATSVVSPLFDSSAGLNIGTSTATGIIIAKTGVTTNVAGPLTESGSVAQTFTGTTTANSITANSVTTGNGLAVSASALTTGSALSVTSSNNTAANTSWSAVMLNLSNVQGTTAVTGANQINGLNVQFNQQASTAAHSNTNVANFAIANNTSSATDNTVDSIINIQNNDSATGNQIQATNGLTINGSAGASGNITNGINLSGTFGTNLITSTNFSVTQGGAITGVGVNSGTGVIQGTGGLTVTGNSTITGTLGSLTGLSSSGTVTFSGLATNGVVSVSGGTLSSSASLPVTEGGTGDTAMGNAYGLVVAGATTTSALTTLANTGTSGYVLQSNGTTGAPSWVSAVAANTCTNCVITNPSASATNTIAPTGNGTVGLTARETTGTAGDILDITNAAGTTTYDSFDSAGGFHTSTVDTATGGGALTLGGTSATSILLGNGNANTTAITLQPGAAASAITLQPGTGGINMNAATIATNQTGTVSLLNTNATTVQAFGAATTIKLGAASTVVQLGGATGTATLDTVAGNLTVQSAAQLNLTSTGALAVTSSTVNISATGAVTLPGSLSQDLTVAAVASTAVGNSLTVQAGTGGSGGHNGGAAYFNAGTAGGAGAGGTAYIQGGANSGTVGSAGGGVAVSGQAGAAGLNASAGAAGGAVTVSAGAGGAGTGTNSPGGAGASATITAGAGGAATGSATGGTGANVQISAGNGGNGVSGGTNGNGGNITLTAGSAGSGAGAAGTAGNINLQGSTVSVGTAGSSLLLNNGATNNAVCSYTGLSGTSTLNTAGKTVNVCTAFDLTDTGAVTVTPPAPTAGAGSVIYISNLAASASAITLVGQTTNPLNVGSTATMVYNGTAWTFAGADAGNLQSDYNDSGSTSPQITLSSADHGVIIDDNSTPIGGTLFGVGANGYTNASGTGYLSVTSAATTLYSSTGGTLDFATGNTGTIQVNAQTTVATAGNNLQVIAAAGDTTGVGGNLQLVAGAGGNAAAGGVASLTGGAAGGGNNAGGAVTVQGGQATGNGAGGLATLQGGSANATAGAGSAGGGVAVTGAAGSTGSGATAGAAGGAVTVAAGAGGAGTGTNSAGGAGASATVAAGAGGAATGSGTGGTGANVQISAGNGGNSVSGTNGSGGNITLTAGAVGTGGSGGTGGNINLQGVTVNVGTAGTSLLENNGATNNAVCSYTGLSGTSTLNTAGKTVNVCTAFDLTDTGAVTVTPPAPTAGAGSVIYISNLAASASAITLVGQTTNPLNVGSTATMVYNGTAWTFAGADAANLQSDYNDSNGAQPQIQETTAGKGLQIADASTTNGNIFTVGSSGMAANYLNVTDTTTTVTDALNQSGGSYSLSGNAASTLATTSGGLTITSAAAATWSATTGQLTVDTAAATTTATAGGEVSIQTGNGDTSGAGGELALTSGNGGTSGVGGEVLVSSGNGGGGNTAGGEIELQGGAGSGTGQGGIMLLQAGAGGNSSGGNGGTIQLQGGNGGTGNGAGGSLTFDAGNATTGATAAENGGNITLLAGTEADGGTAGSVIAKSGTNSATGFQVQNSSGTAVMKVDTTDGNGCVVVGNTTAAVQSYSTCAGQSDGNGTLIVDSGTANYSGLTFADLNSSDVNTSNTTVYGQLLGVDANGNVGVSNAAVSLTSPALAYWDGLNDPTTGPTGCGSACYSYPTATTSGTATFISSTSGEQITPAVSSESGSINWSFAQVPYEEIQFSMKATSTTSPHADATWFYSYADGVPTTEYGTGLQTPAGASTPAGYIIYFSEYHGCAGISYGGFSDGNQCVSGGGTSGDPLQAVSMQPINGVVGPLDDGNWHNVDIQILYNQIIVRWDGQVILDYADAYGRNTSYQDFGFGGRNGSDNDARYIKDLLVTKLGTNTSQYDINTSNAPLANDLYWDNTSTGSVGTSNYETSTANSGNLGVDTADPNANLEVDGTSDFDTVDGTGTACQSNSTTSCAATAGNDLYSAAGSFNTAWVGDKITFENGYSETITSVTSTTAAVVSGTAELEPTATTFQAYQPTLTLTNGAVNVGSNSSTNTNPTLLELDNDHDAAGSEPTGTNGAMYYNTVMNQFRCYKNGAWEPCDGIWQTLTQTADTSVTNSATFAADTNLEFAVAASTKYSFRCMVYFGSTNATPGFKWEVTGPASPTAIDVSHQAIEEGEAAGNAGAGLTDVGVNTAASTSNAVAAAAAGDGSLTLNGQWNNGTTAGTWIFNWAQNTATSGATTYVRQGSYCDYASF